MVAYVNIGQFRAPYNNAYFGQDPAAVLTPQCYDANLPPEGVADLRRYLETVDDPKALRLAAGGAAIGGYPKAAACLGDKANAIEAGETWPPRPPPPPEELPAANGGAVAWWKAASVPTKAVVILGAMLAVGGIVAITIRRTKTTRATANRARRRR